MSGVVYGGMGVWAEFALEWITRNSCVGGHFRGGVIGYLMVTQGLL